MNRRPLVIGNRLIFDLVPDAFDLQTGEVFADEGYQKRGQCGLTTASATQFFRRSGTMTGYDSVTKDVYHLTTLTRPGCGINMLPVCGLLLVPEASAGCTCMAATIQTSIAFLPKKQPLNAAVQAELREKFFRVKDKSKKKQNKRDKNRLEGS